MAWGDYDNDGRLDFLLTGATNTSTSTAISQLWRNTGSGFSNVTASVAPGLPGVSWSSVVWADYDNDGRLDFLLTGFSSTTGRASQLWRNTGSGFSIATASVVPGLPRVSNGSVAWGDYDNDGRLDFLFTGSTDGRPSGAISQLWRNNLPLSNAPPVAPAGLAAAVSGNTVTLNWSASTDDLTPATGLNYNVRIGFGPGGANSLSPQALTNGTRLLPQMGNAGHNLNAFVHSLPAGNYFWSVQAVDTSFAGSPFAAEQQFTIPLLLMNPTRLPDGRYRLQFLARPAPYSIHGTNNVAVPGTNWPRLGTPFPVGPNLFEFIDNTAPTQPRRYYLLRSP